MNNPLMLSDEVQYRINDVLKYAHDHPYSMDDLLDIMNGTLSPAGANPKHVVSIPVYHEKIYYKVIYCIEEQNDNRFKHITISTPSKVPNRYAVKEIIRQFGVDIPLRDCKVDRYKFGPEHDECNAISILVLLERKAA